MGKLLHAIAHLLKWNEGRVVTKLDEDSNVWVGFQCDQCGKVQERTKLGEINNV